ncbi:MAG: polysaccharide biosynthesis C-terminal domain-containing protein, partial [Candidatus Heimdallarchaeota archaeon]|nr:polysaccharide biosynthesis C-terminal domain-containing protein [Candidatus Heimdallarchaeota archaeon]
VMKYFVISALAIFLMVNFYMDLFKHFIGRDFHEGLHIVPVVLFANILLGIFFNLSIWYKLNDLTKYGAIITVTGAGITFMVNWFLIPVYGYLASAWAHVICYGSMVVLSWALGRRFYKIPYQLTRILMYVFLALALYAVSELISSGNTFTDMAKNTGLLAVFIIIVFFKEKKLFNSI